MLGIFFILGLYRLFRTWPGMAWLNLLAGIFVLIFSFALHVFFYARFMVFLLPFFFLGLAESFIFLEENIIKTIAGFRKNTLQLLLGCLVCVLFIASLSRYYQMGKQNFKGAASYIEEKYPDKEALSFGLAHDEFLYYDPIAIPHSGMDPLHPDQISGKLIVGNFRWSWSQSNKEIINRYCPLEKKWISAGYRENDIYLFRCF